MATEIKSLVHAMCQLTPPGLGGDWADTEAPNGYTSHAQGILGMYRLGPGQYVLTLVEPVEFRTSDPSAREYVQPNAQIFVNNFATPELVTIEAAFVPSDLDYPSSAPPNYAGSLGIQCKDADGEYTDNFIAQILVLDYPSTETPAPSQIGQALSF